MCIRDSFLTSYQNYSPSDVDDHWSASLNMMTRNLRGYTLKAMADDNTRGKIDDGQIQSVFHLRELDAVAGAVSYTHLDVYKRQVLSNPQPIGIRI